MPRGVGFAIVITNQGGDDGPLAALETWNVSMQGQVFAVLVVPAMTDGMADIMEQRPSFEEDARLARKMMDWLERVKKHDTQFSNVLGVALVIFETTRKTARTDEKLARRSGV